MSTIFTRGEFLRLTAAAAAGWIARQPSADDRLDRVARIIESYDRQGIHRTATDVDDVSGRWLAAEARSAGADAGLERFTLDRVDVRACKVSADGRTVDALPLFDGGFTTPEGVSGRLGAANADADIAVVDLNQAAISSEGRSLDALRTSPLVRAVVGVTRGARPGLVPMNAARFLEPFGVPVVQVGSAEGPWLEALARKGARATVHAHVLRISDTASNVVAEVRGSSPDLAPVMVITPRSGWWHCASERGGGIACWVETIRAAAAARLPRTVQLVASSGHELGHLGLDAFIAERDAVVKGATAWIHLGANIGAAGGQMRLQTSDDGIEAMAGAALERAGAAIANRVPRGTIPAGEARNIHVGGGRYVSVLGSGAYFHNLDDRWPVAVDAAAVARYAAAVSDLTIALARS
jgi:hypothetical protein